MKLKQIKDFIQAYRNVDRNVDDYYYFKHLDQAILTACRKNPAHNDASEVFAKIVLINRTYRANLDRYLDRPIKDVEWRLAEKFVDGNIDKELLPLKNIRRFNRNSIDTIVQVHEKLVQLAYTITKRTQNSFCSKYLSFHFLKTVPIFDSHSYDASWRLVGNQVKAARFDENRNFDYGYHCEAILLLVEVLLRRGIKNPDLKLVDCVLYGER
jgi:hypothetical protein